MELLQGENTAVALDALVNDLLHGDMSGVLHDLREPHNEAHDQPAASTEE